MVDEKKYFTINRARQYGKTTTLKALANYLQDDYCVLSLDFQKISKASYRTEEGVDETIKLLLADGNNPLFGSVMSKLENGVN